MSFWSSVGGFVSQEEKNTVKKAKGYDENQKEFAKIKQYLSEKRAAFYKNNNIKER